MERNYRSGEANAKRSGPGEPPERAIAQGPFREAMGHFATGVTVVTAVDRAGGFVGLTVNSFTSVSLDPPLVLVCVDRESETLPILREAGAFAVSVLRRGDEAIARRFSGDARAGRFEELAVRPTASGAPVLRDALAWFDCAVHGETAAGDHVVIFGAVRDGGGAPGDPLVFFRGGYGTVR